ncbi:MAG TPA: hypothetical protein VGP82_04820 [Ktedonobacterales bacterium]|jgi:hypothetical protein|nr:hypothetical protein [Ktedonobacterales bacterium]
MRIEDLLKKLEAAEHEFLSREVLAPLLPARPVQVRIAGIVCSLKVERGAFTGWAVLQPLAVDRARVVRPASLSEVRAYLQLFPPIRLITVVRDGASWLALAAHAGDTRIRFDQPAPVWLTEESVQPFETLVARFDGSLFWFERRDSRSNPALAAYLRQAAAEDTPPEQLHKPGLSAEERAAYTWVWQLAEDARLRAHEVRLADALRHASGRLRSFIERDDRYTVTYEVDGERHVSNVGKRDLSVLTSGICLSGRDRDFDLTSLVGVMREASGRPIPRWDVDPDEEPEDE